MVLASNRVMRLRDAGSTFRNELSVRKFILWRMLGAGWVTAPAFTTTRTRAAQTLVN